MDLHHHRPQGVQPVAHEPRRHQLWLDQPPRMIHHLYFQGKTKKIRTWKFGTTLEMAPCFCCFCYWNQCKSMSWERISLPQKRLQLYSNVDSSFPSDSFLSRFEGFCCSLGMKDSIVYENAWNKFLPPTLFSWKLEELSQIHWNIQKTSFGKKQHIANRLCLHSPVKQTSLALKINQPQVISTNLNGVSAMLHQLGNVTICQCNCEASRHGRNDLTR